MASPSTLKLIGPTMFRSFRCVWMLEELNVPYQHILAKPWSKTAKQYNPQGKIPTLVDGDLVISESAAINTYLGNKYPSQNLVPTTCSSNLEQVAKFHQTTLTIMTDMDALGLWIHRKHDVLSQYFGKCPTAVQEAKRQYQAVQAVLVTQLETEGPYLLGSDFAAVDILYVHCLDWAKSIGWFNADDEENGSDALMRYLNLCHSRPAYQRTLAKRKAEEQAEREKKRQTISKL